METILILLITVTGEIVTHYIIKWLDGKKQISKQPAVQAAA